jgi:peroxiredoxin Q/BCP
MLTLNSVAPDFELPDQHGTNVRLSDLRGKWVLLWWYPKASTRG